MHVLTVDNGLLQDEGDSMWSFYQDPSDYTDI